MTGITTTIPGASPAASASGAAPMSERELAEIICAFNDVTAKLHGAHESLRAEVVRLQAELSSANEQLERSRRLAALGEMAAGIAHEVRNPLGSIGLYARMLVQDLPERPAQRQLAEKIGSAVRGLDAVVNDVLAFAREMPVNAGEVDAGELVERAVEEGRHGVNGEGVRIEQAGDARMVWCDAGLAHRAIVNVVRNAVEAAGGVRGVEGVVRVERVEQVHGSGGVVVRVSDSGPGVSVEVKERMFNPFFTTRATGTGLGLAIVHRIMDAHAGAVRVRNASADEGGLGGAVVELWFPGRGGESGEQASVAGAVGSESVGVGEASSDTVIRGGVPLRRERKRR